MLALVQVPEHGDTVLTTRCGKRTVRGDRDGVDVTGVAVVVGLQLELGELPDLIGFVSTSRKSTRSNARGQRSW